MRRTAILVAALVVAMACSGDLGGRTPRPTLGNSVPELRAALDDPDADVRLEAAKRLGTVGDVAAVPALVEATSDANQEVALAAIDALGAIGGDASTDALLDLTATLPGSDDLEGAVRFEGAIAALAKVGGGAAVGRLLELMVDEDLGSGAWLAVDDALGSLDRSDAKAVIPALAHEDTPVRLEAIKRLGKIGGPDAAQALIPLVASKDSDTSEAAIDAIGDIGDTKATAALVKALSNDTLFARATGALVKIHKDDATPLLAFLKSKSTVRVYLALVRIGQSGTEAALITALNKFGTKDMAEDYLNCGNTKLEKAAKTWASKHGYSVITLPGGGAVTWGED